tara:strand:- start:169 stop:513 length:345 start_codon:yes stop_codon:yes gene_type:complete
MGRSGYTSLSIQQDEYSRIRKKWDRYVDPTTDLKFTPWAQSTIEGGIERIKFLESAFPNISVVKIIEKGIVLDDKKKNDVVKVWVQGKKIVCSDKSKDAESYILYAVMHPEFAV